MPRWLPVRIDRRTARRDAVAGVVLGVESVPDGLASGLLAGLNPVAGLYAYLFGLAGASFVAGTTVMAVQGTGAMSIIVADVRLDRYDDPVRALCTLSLLTGGIMVLAGVLRLGRLLRFVSNSVMTGFVAAVGVNIVLGQLDDLTGYSSSGANRVTRALDLMVHLRDVDAATLLVGLATMAGIVSLERTGLGASGLVVAVVLGSVLAGLLDARGQGVALVSDIADVPSGLPLPVAPDLAPTLDLLLPAASLAFVGLVQGAGVAAAFPAGDGQSNVSRDFVGQGVGNLASGLFRGMPVGGSMSATSLVVSAGGRSRLTHLTAAVVMAVVVMAFSQAVGLVAMPALAALLIVVGVATVKPRKLLAVGSTGPVPLTVMCTTFVLTLLIPVQYAVLVGVGMSVLLFVIGQSSRLVTRRLVIGTNGRVIETNPPQQLPADEVVVLQPYGPMFFATAPALRTQLPDVGPGSSRSVVILRLRGAEDAGSTLLDVLGGYGALLRTHGSRLMVVTDNTRLADQVVRAGALAAEDVVLGGAVVWDATLRAHEEAQAWVRRDRPDGPTTDTRDERSGDPHWGDVPPDGLAL